jgi:hypothetical protein
MVTVDDKWIVFSEQQPVNGAKCYLMMYQGQTVSIYAVYNEKLNVFKTLFHGVVIPSKNVYKWKI